MMLAKAAERAGDLERRELLLRAGAHVSSRSAMLAYFLGPALVEEAQAVHAEVERMEERLRVGRLMQACRQEG